MRDIKNVSSYKSTALLRLRQNRLLRLSCVVITDTLLVTLAWYGAYWLRFNLSIPPHDALIQAHQLAIVMIITQLIAARLLGLHRGIWRHVSINELGRIIKTVLVTTLVLTIFVFYAQQGFALPRSIPPLFSILAISFLSAARLSYRWLREKQTRTTKDAKRMLIIGAGNAAETLIRDLLRNKHDYRPVGLLDDNPVKIGTDIHGVRVLGKTAELQKHLNENLVDLVLIAIPSASATTMRRLVELCEETRITYRTLPTLNDIATGRAKLTTIREVSLEDLLSRDPIKFDWQSLGKCVSNKTVLVTGAGGSIGSELCRQIANLGPKQLLIIDHAEFNLFNIEQELIKNFPAVKLFPLLFSITDKGAVNATFEDHQPDIIFHAAAYKHVPLLENQALAAVENNILGTQILANAAIDYHIPKFIFISTDKAVNPTNVMGASKRCAELICQSLGNQTYTDFITVRFGNVLGSAGSAVPIFKQQIANGGPVTVTHPEISRYFMTIPEATQLILNAASIGQNSELFVLDMGEPIKISYLVQQLIRLIKGDNNDIEVIYTGLRPGEKLYEELFYSYEQLVPSINPKLRHARFSEFNSTRFSEKLALLLEKRSELTHNQIREILFDLIEIKISCLDPAEPNRSGFDKEVLPQPKETSPPHKK